MTVFSYPLYHGTSEMHLPSIEKHGLGGRSILQELRVRDAFSDIDAFFRSKEIEMEGMDEFVRERIRSESGSYQYGDTYATTCLDTAWGFAERQGGCGELAGFVARMVERATAAGYRPDRERYPIFDVIRRQSRPVVLQLDNIAIADALYESGGTVPPERVPPWPCGNTRYRFRVAIPWERITVLRS